MPKFFSILRGSSEGGSSWFKKGSKEPKREQVTLERVAPVSSVSAPKLVAGEQEVPLQVVLKGHAKFERARTHTRLRKAPIKGHSDLLQSWLAVTGPIDAQNALSIGVAASELGAGVVQIAVPEGPTAMEQLRLLRACADRFEFSIVFKTKNFKQALEIAHWSDAVEVNLKELEGAFLRRLDMMKKGLVIRRPSQISIQAFREKIRKIRGIFRGTMIIVEAARPEGPGIFAFNHGALIALMREDRFPVLVELQDPMLNSNERDALALSAVGSSASGVILRLDTSDQTHLAESFDELGVLLQKLNAVRYTLNALRHL